MKLSQMREELGHYTMPNDVYQSRIRHILQCGDIVNPRGMPIIEQVGAWLTYDCLYPVVSLNERRLNYSFMFAEAAWILSGSNKLNDVVGYMSRLREFSDDGQTMSGAYGPPFVGQVPYILETLRRDQDSRQAVMTIWRQSPTISKDIPCTVSIQFLVRHQQLNAIIFMRSSDALLGLPYDMFTFAMMTHFIAIHLGLHVGNNTIFIGSSHAYSRDFDRLEKIRDEKEYGDYDPINSLVFNTPGDLVDALWSLANTQGCGYWVFDQFQSWVAERKWVKNV